MNSLDSLSNKSSPLVFWDSLTEEQQNTIVAVGALAALIIVSVGIYSICQASHSSNGVMTSSLNGKISSISSSSSSYNQKILNIIDELKKLNEQNGGHFTIPEYRKVLSLLDELNRDPNIGMSGFPTDWQIWELKHTYASMFGSYHYYDLNPTMPLTPENLESFVKLLQGFLR